VLVDAPGNEVPVPELAFKADFGRLERTGPADAVLSVPAHFQGRTEVAVRASARGFVGEVRVALKSAAPSPAEPVAIAAERSADRSVLPFRRPWALSAGLFAVGRSNLVRASAGGAALE